MDYIYNETFRKPNRYDIRLKKFYDIKLFGKKYRIELAIEGIGMTAKQKISLDAFKHNKDKLCRLAERSIYDYYVQKLQDIREYIDSDEWDVLAPNIENVRDLRRFFRPYKIIIPKDTEDGNTAFKIAFDSTWEWKDSLVIKFVDQNASVFNEEII